MITPPTTPSRARTDNRVIAPGGNLNGQQIIAVVGVADTGVIGAGGTIPWHSPRDMKHFREVTAGRPIVMGRKTFDSIGKPLPGRHNVVLTRSAPPAIEGVSFVSSREEALELLSSEPEIMIIGGEEIYRQFYADLTRIELTLLKLPAAGDAFFSLDASRDWRIVDEVTEHDPKLGAELVFRTYEPDISDNKYLSSDVKGLLRMFGAGEAVPGSGAAAALQALLSAYLSQTVISKTREKFPVAEHRIFAQYAFRISTGIVPRLRDLFLQDIAVFEDVVELRRRRNAATGVAKGRISRQHNAKMVEATAIPNEIFELAQELAQIADFLFLKGWKWVRGDSGAAVSSAVSAMLSSTFIVALNLETMGNSAAALEWSQPLAARNRQSLAMLARLPALINLSPEDDETDQFLLPGLLGENE